MDISVEFTGGWVSITDELLMQCEEWLEFSRDITRECGEITLNEIVNYIASGGEGSWPPLSKSWANRKGSDEFYYDTGEFISALSVEEVGEDAFFVGVPDGVHNNSGLEYSELLALLEDKLDRPIFEPALERAIPKIQQTIANYAKSI